MRDGSGKWLPSQWQRLMDLTLQAFDSVMPEGGPAPLWTFGGGTALAIDLQHRISYDLDAFVDSAGVIQSLVPVRNETTRRICWNPETGRADYNYPGHYLKLIVKDVGEIDFLGASSILADATVPFAFEGRIISRERSAEVIAKKIYHRGATFKSRDLFDLAGTYLVLRDELAHAAASPFLTPDVYSRLRLRIETRKDALKEGMHEEVNPTPFGQSYIHRTYDLAIEALEFMESGGTSGTIGKQ